MGCSECPECSTLGWDCDTDEDILFIGGETTDEYCYVSDDVTSNLGEQEIIIDFTEVTAEDYILDPLSGCFTSLFAPIAWYLKNYGTAPVLFEGHYVRFRKLHLNKKIRATNLQRTPPSGGN